MHTYQSRNGGYTLIEALIVIAIIAIIGAMLNAAINHVKHPGSTATQFFNSSDPRPSPVIPPISPASVNVGYRLQVNDPNQYVAVANLLKANGYAVEPVNEKTCLVFKPGQK